VTLHGAHIGSVPSKSEGTFALWAVRHMDSAAAEAWIAADQAAHKARIEAAKRVTVAA
jgi:hypothetical protein